jgi:hypothetical protein
MAPPSPIWSQIFRIFVSDLNDAATNGDENSNPKTSTSFPDGILKLKKGALIIEIVDRKASPPMTAGSRSFERNNNDWKK